MSLKIHSILVVDDSPTNQLLIKQQLEYLGYEVELVENGEQALQVLASSKFDVLMTDINMPGMDGYQLVHEIRSTTDRDISSIPIIAITASATEEDKQKCLSAGMDGFITKPIELNSLKRYLLDLQDKGRKGIEQAANKTSEATQTTVAIPSNSVSNESLSLDADILDISGVSDFVGGNMQLVLQLLKAFLEQTPKIIDEIHDACSQDDTNGVVNSCHKLKSSARSVGANRLSDICIAMESAGKADRLALVKEIEPLFDKVFTDTRAAIDNLTRQ